MMRGLCGAKCDECGMQEQCKGCTETCGSPWGGQCVAAEYIRVGGVAAYEQFREKLRTEINELLKSEGASEAEKLYELPGSYVNLAYELPNGYEVKFLEDKDIYLGCQVEADDKGLCYGAVGNAGFILICRYGANGNDPELVRYQKR